METPTSERRPESSAARWAAGLRQRAGSAARADTVLPLDALLVPFRAAVVGDTVTPPAFPSSTGECAFWWARVDERVAVHDLVDAGADGPLLPVEQHRAIEVWTDAELSAVHALWWLARSAGEPPITARLDRALAWHLLHTQPDNATNRPWALHAFLLLGTPEGTHYAATLLHNAEASRATGGDMNPLSAWIMLDSARALEAVSGE